MSSINSFDGKPYPEVVRLIKAACNQHNWEYLQQLVSSTRLVSLQPQSVEPNDLIDETKGQTLAWISVLIAEHLTVGGGFLQERDIPVYLERRGVLNHFEIMQFADAGKQVCLSILERQHSAFKHLLQSSAELKDALAYSATLMACAFRDRTFLDAVGYEVYDKASGTPGRYTQLMFEYGFMQPFADLPAGSFCKHLEAAQLLNSNSILYGVNSDALSRIAELTFEDLPKDEPAYSAGNPESFMRFVRSSHGLTWGTLQPGVQAFMEQNPRYLDIHSSDLHSGKAVAIIEGWTEQGVLHLCSERVLGHVAQNTGLQFDASKGAYKLSQGPVRSAIYERSVYNDAKATLDLQATLIAVIDRHPTPHAFANLLVNRDAASSFQPKEIQLGSFALIHKMDRLLLKLAGLGLTPEHLEKSMGSIHKPPHYEQFMDILRAHQASQAAHQALHDMGVRSAAPQAKL